MRDKPRTKQTVNASGMQAKEKAKSPDGEKIPDSYLRLKLSGVRFKVLEPRCFWLGSTLTVIRNVRTESRPRTSKHILYELVLSTRTVIKSQISRDIRR
jgi:hypothetical protein